MSQHDYAIADQNGLAFLADLNDALLAIASNNSGATTPATTYAYQWWADTAGGILKRRNATNTAWISVMTLTLAMTTFGESIASAANAAAARTAMGAVNIAGDTLTGKLIHKVAANIASATTTDLSAATGDGGHITGSVTITGVTMTAGQMFVAIFDDILTLTHHATNNNLPTAANITTAAGDRALYWYDGTTVYCLAYLRANGKAVAPLTAADIPVTIFPAGTVIQNVSSVSTSASTGSTLIPLDDTIPQNTEGDQYMSQAITPKNSANTLIVDVTIVASHSVSGHETVALFEDSAGNAIAAVTVKIPTGGDVVTIRLRHIMTAGATSSKTFKVRVGNNNAGSTTINGSGGTRLFAGVCESSIVISEVVA